MDSIETILDQLSLFLQKLYGLPAYTLVGIACIIIGYLLRFWKAFPNNGIPLVVILFGAIAYPIVADYNNEDSIRVLLGKYILFGLLIGFVAWLVHNKFLKPLEDKFGLFTGNNKTPSPPTETTTTETKP